MLLSVKLIRQLVILLIDNALSALRKNYESNKNTLTGEERVSTSIYITSSRWNRRFLSVHLYQNITNKENSLTKNYVFKSIIEIVVIYIIDHS